MNLVLDASAGFELLLTTTAGQAILRKVPPRAEWWVPEHYFIEVAGAVRRAEYTKAITSAQAVAAFGALSRGRLHRVQVRPLLDDAWARRGHLTVADAVYVILAEQLAAALVTADLKLAQSPGLRVSTITPRRADTTPDAGALTRDRRRGPDAEKGPVIRAFLVSRGGRI